jgi:hypothetical protein
MKITEPAIGWSVAILAVVFAVFNSIGRNASPQPRTVAHQEATAGAASQALCGCELGAECICKGECKCKAETQKKLDSLKPKLEVATTAPLAPNGLPYQYQWAPPGPKPATQYYNYAWMPDSQGSEYRGWWLMPNGQPAVQPVYQQQGGSCGPGGCSPRGIFGRR